MISTPSTSSVPRHFMERAESDRSDEDEDNHVVGMWKASTEMKSFVAIATKHSANDTAESLDFPIASVVLEAKYVAMATDLPMQVGSLHEEDAAEDAITDPYCMWPSLKQGCRVLFCFVGKR